MKYVPHIKDIPSPSLDELERFVRGRSCAVLTGAGCSTESGIPDYRGPETKRRARNPITYQEYVRDEATRARYWARSAIGWPRFRAARPNDAHRALAALEEAGHVNGVITQNVDRLHHAAGSRRVIELHGALAQVRCLECGEIEHRDSLQERILALNPGWDAEATEIAPDGDVDLPEDATQGFCVPQCRRCHHGQLKPNVVFFGENVPKPTVARAFSLLDDADALLVVGSSLAVYSGYRFVKKAAACDKPIAIANLGQTRGHPHADVVIEGLASDILTRLTAQLS